jgi:hypothetical protein
MKKITESIAYEGLPLDHTDLHQALKEFHVKHPFQTGIDWQFQTRWAVLEDQDAFAFSLKYPEFAHRFKDV